MKTKARNWFSYSLPLYKERLKNPKAVYLILTPEHGNLGDHAIAQAEIGLLGELGVPFIEVTGEKLKERKCNNLLHIMNGRPIIINGGGNLGTLWFDVEELMRSVVEANPRSKIMIFPNTIFYEDSAWGREEFEKSKAVYNSHRKLKMYARESFSFDVMKNAYNDVSLVPDIVLRMNKCTNGSSERRGCVLCMRKDLEKTRSSADDEIIANQAAELFGDNVSERDMNRPEAILPPERDAALEEQYSAFRSAELVITDRLHGMIFAAVTGTPCIVINSRSPKVRSSYEWLRGLEYIRFAETASDIISEYKKIPAKAHKYDNSALMPYFDRLKSDVSETVSKRRHKCRQ